MPAASNDCSTAAATVDFPEAGSPVSHTVAAAWPAAVAALVTGQRTALPDDAG